MAGRWRRFVVRPLVWLVVAIAAAVAGLHFFLDSQLARSRARELLQARMGEALGRRVTIEKVDFSLVPLWLALDGVTIAGDRPDEPPFATVVHAEVDADWQGARRRVLELARVSLTGVDLHLSFRADGSDNLPRPPKAKGGGGVELRLGGLYVDDGRVELDEATAPFALAAEAVDLRAIGLAGGVLDAAAGAQKLQLRLPDAQPLDTAFAVHLRLAENRLEVLRARLSAPDLSVGAKGTIELTRPTTVALETTLETSGELLDRLGWLHGELAGPFRFDGEFGWRERVWKVNGDLASPSLELLGFELADLAGKVEGSPRAARLALERASYAGGALAGSFEVALARPFHSKVQLDVVGAEIERVLSQFDLPVKDIRGAASGPFRYEFDLLQAAKGEGQGSFVLGPAVAQNEPGLEVGGSVELRLAGGELELPKIELRAGGESVTGNGRLALAGGVGTFDLEVATEELGALMKQLTFLPSGELWVPTAGTAKAKVTLALAPGDVQAQVAIEAGGVEAPGVRAERVVAQLEANETAVTFSSLELFRPGGTLAMTGTIPLTPSAEAKSGAKSGARPPPFALHFAVDGWPLDELRPWLPFTLPVEGKVAGTLALSGGIDALEGAADLVVPGATVAGIASHRLAARFDFDPAELRLKSGRVELDAGAVNATGTVALDSQKLALEITAPELALDRAPLVALGGGALTGKLALEGRVGGTISLPAITLDGHFAELALSGESLSEGADRGAPEPRLVARWEDGKLDAELALSGLARLKGGGEFRPGEATRLEFQLASDRLDRIARLATGEAAAGIEGGIEAVLAVDVPKDGAPSAELLVPTAEFRWHGRRVKSLEPIRAKLDGKTVEIESLYLGLVPDSGASSDELFVSGEILFEDNPRLDLHLQADVGAELVRPMVGDLDLGGRITLLADLEGTASAPELRGEGEWSAGRYLPAALPQIFDQGHALVLLYPDAIVLDRLSGRIGGGEVQASGRVDLKGGTAESYRFEAALRRVALRYPPGWQTRGDADLTLASTAAGRQITGTARFDRVYYFQDINLSPTQLIERLLARSRVIVPETDEVMATTSLNVAISAPESVRVKNNVADLVASADLALRGSLARPVVFGEVRTSPGGRVTYSGNRYEIERGLLTFANATRIDPQLDIVARTKVDEYNVSLILGGPLSRPVASFASDPPLADLEILGLLTTGSAPSGALFSDRVARTDPNTGGAGAVGAESMLYGQAASLVGARVGKLFGFDQVRVEPLTSGDAVSSARVTVGKRLSSRLFVTYSVDPTSTAQEILQAEYRVSDRLVLVLTQNGNESFSVDARWESRF